MAQGPRLPATVDRQVVLKRVYEEYDQDPAFNHLRDHHPPKRIVPGRGSMTPELIIVGEAPGEAEALSRKPFHGPAGKVLDKLLTRVGLERGQIFITNVVKYRPTVGVYSIRNRTPNTHEIMASRSYLIREIEAFDPGTPVVTLGKSALRALHSKNAKLANWHGRGWYDAHRMYVSLYHPAVALYEKSMLPILQADFEIVRELIR